MGSGFVHACDEESDTVWSLAIVLGIGLGAVTDERDEPGDGDCAAVGEAGREGLLFHEVREDAGVGGETGETESKVFVD